MVWLVTLILELSLELHTVATVSSAVVRAGAGIHHCASPDRADAFDGDEVGDSFIDSPDLHCFKGMGCSNSATCCNSARNEGTATWSAYCAIGEQEVQIPAPYPAVVDILARSIGLFRHTDSL